MRRDFDMVHQGKYVLTIIPTFNRAHMLLSAIKSVLGQTFKDIRIVVVDDGSTDDTPRICQKYAKERPGSFSYVYKENGGCASARNLGLSKINDEIGYVTFLDSDDQWFPSAVEKWMEVLEKSDADFVYSPAVEINVRGLERLNYPSAAGRPDQLAVEFFKDTNVRAGTVLYRKKIFDKVRGFREELRHNEDSDFLQRVAIQFRAAYCHNPSLKVFRHESNKSNDRVALNQALLKSSLDTLEGFPHFREILGKAGLKRIQIIRSELIEALIRSDNWAEVMRVSSGIPMKGLKMRIKLSLWLHTGVPVFLWVELMRMKRRVLKLLGK